MKLDNSVSTRLTLSELRRLPAGPAKLAKRLRLLEASVKELPLDANAPAPVSEAHKVYEAEAVRAKQAAAKVEAAEAEAKAAAIRDVAAAAEAMRAGKPAPKPSQAKAAEAVTSALVDTEAAGTLLETAHDELIDSVKEAWPTWRAQLIKDAASAHAAAAGALEKAAAAVASARGLYAGVGSLDHGVLSRDPKILEAVQAERRGDLPWYESACAGPLPLQRVSVPGVSHNGTPHASDLSIVVEALRLAVAAPADFTAGNWVPPGDERHDDLLAAPLDLEEPWVIAAVRSDWGSTCATCRRPGADTVEEQTGRGLVMVHAKCQNKEPDAKAQRNAERLAKMRAHGFPPSPNEASQLVPDGGRVQKDDGR